MTNSPFLSLPINLGANSSAVIPLPFPSKVTIKSFPSFFQLKGLHPRPKFTSLKEPKRKEGISNCLDGLNPFSAAILTSIVGVEASMGTVLRTDRSKSFFSGIQMFFELWRSFPWSSHLMVSITAKFICMGRPSLS